MRFRVRLGGVIVMETESETFVENMSQRGFYVDGIVTCRSTGVAGTVMSQGGVVVGSGVNARLWDMVETAATAMDTTGARVFDITVEWGAASVNNTITSTNFYLSALN